MGPMLRRLRKCRGIGRSGSFREKWFCGTVQFQPRLLGQQDSCPIKDFPLNAEYLVLLKTDERLVLGVRHKREIEIES